MELHTHGPWRSTRRTLPSTRQLGRAVGIITFKKGNADNIGFALNLGEVKSAAEQAEQKAAQVKPVPGPLDPGDLPVIASIAPKKDNWDATGGELRENKGTLVLENNGGAYWVTSKTPLPQNFQLVVQCRIEFLKGNQQLQPSQRSMLRTLCVRFDTPQPLKGGQKFCLGGYLSRLHIGDVSVIKLEAAPAKADGDSPPSESVERPGLEAKGVKVDEKPSDPRGVAPEFDKVPLFDLSKGAGLPGYLKASPAMLGDASGLRGGEARIATPNLDGKDYTFDVLFQFNDEEQAIGVTAAGPGPKPTDPKLPAASGATGIEGREHLIRLTGVPLPSYLRAQPGLTFETGGGLVLRDHQMVRTPVWSRPRRRRTGRALFHSVGRVTRHAPRDDKEIAREGAVELGHVPAKYSLASLGDFLIQPTRVRPSGRMPDMKLTPVSAGGVGLLFPIREVRCHAAHFGLALQRDDIPRHVGADVAAEPAAIQKLEQRFAERARHADLLAIAIQHRMSKDRHHVTPSGRNVGRAKNARPERGQK